MSDERLPAPWTSRPCEHCGAEHPPTEDCLVPELDQPPEIDLFSALTELFGPPEEFLPGIYLFTREPKQ